MLFLILKLYLCGHQPFVLTTVAHFSLQPKKSTNDHNWYDLKRKFLLYSLRLRKEKNAIAEKYDSLESEHESLLKEHHLTSTSLTEEQKKVSHIKPNC